ncbi:hypothetical protein CXQ85_001996 [Candidozyma haemuli]|uniref:Uncharacterized protein n=1 Tax=Candidozyma haemuli TaxID=45357 RepID=A0A2V1ASE1_9ASCO|nr:hypothetical protein CXQ85_001996 [[Candida] haemuloni]PVH20213.1 hypothetical protein CXQ85_001996 [[Candida] haemuloni]
MSSLALPYTFPRAPSVDPEAHSLSRDAQVNRDLDINVRYSETKPSVAREPYVKCFRSNENSPESIVVPQDNPLDDILGASQQAIEAYILDMPYTKMFTPAEPKTPPLNKKRSRKILDGKKENKQAEDARVPKARKTPVKARQSLKNSVLRQEHGKNNDQDEADVSIQDPLACHAENIMRMAMDSTMMSSFNNSFSSTFSNLNEDSILGKRNLDKENSFGPSGRAAPVLDKSKSTLVEISASDLEQAVSEPYFK